MKTNQQDLSRVVPSWVELSCLEMITEVIMDWFYDSLEEVRNFFWQQILFFRQEIFLAKKNFCKIFGQISLASNLIFLRRKFFMAKTFFNKNSFINKILLPTFLIEVFKFFNWSTWSLQLKYLKSSIEVFRVFGWSLWSLQLKNLTFPIEVIEVFNWSNWSLQLKYLKSSIK